MWGSVETTVKLGLTGLAGFTLACVVIETSGSIIGKTVAGSSDSQNYFVTRTAIELLLSLYVADFVTGLIHMLLDFQTVDDDELRLHIETSVEAVEAFEKTKLFTEATERDRYLWNFHSHHEAVYPSSDSQLELFMQLFWYVRVVWPLFYPVHKSNCRSGAGSMAWRHAPDSLVDLRTGSTSATTMVISRRRRPGSGSWP